MYSIHTHIHTGIHFTTHTHWLTIHTTFIHTQGHTTHTYKRIPHAKTHTQSTTPQLFSHTVIHNHKQARTHTHTHPQAYSLTHAQTHIHTYISRISHPSYYLVLTNLHTTSNIQILTRNALTYTPTHSDVKEASIYSLLPPSLPPSPIIIIIIIIVSSSAVISPGRDKGLSQLSTIGPVCF